MEEQIGYGNTKAVTDFEQKYPELAVYGYRGRAVGVI
jgi:hypothetical protein